MDKPNPLPGITSYIIDTPRLKQHVLTSGAVDGVPVIFLHGNFSSALYFEETMQALPAGFRGIAVDMRGYGWTEDKLIDATRGYRDWVAQDRKSPSGWLVGGLRYHLPIYRRSSRARPVCHFDLPGLALWVWRDARRERDAVI